MDIAKSDLVLATAGREKGRLFFVVDIQNEYLLLADGKSRRLEAPKRKKCRYAAIFLGTGKSKHMIIFINTRGRQVQTARSPQAQEVQARSARGSRAGGTRRKAQKQRDHYKQ